MSRRADDPAEGERDSKRSRTDGAAPAPAMSVGDIRAQLAAKKAAVEARLAAAREAKSAAAPPPAAASASSSSSSAAPAPQSVGPSSMPPAPKMDTAMADRVAAAKARIDALKSRSNNPYLSGSGSMPKAEPAARPSSGSTSSVALHPLLMGGQSQQQQQEQPKQNEKMAMRDRYKPMAPKYSSIKANVGAAPSGSSSPAPVAAVINPYASGPSTSNAAEDGPSAPVRRSRKLNFAAQGKYVKQGDQLRADAKLEALKQRIAERSRKQGLESEFDTLEKSLKRQPPPAVEWWDSAIMPENSTYDDIDKAMDWLSTASDSLVTHLVQHPIPIPAPGDKKQQERDLMLTKKEQKKMRRQRRKAELEDKQDRQKMGLIPPDAPKVRLANLMKVLTSDAVQDPTKVEAKVRREVQARADKHEHDNQERKLTVEERHQKDYQKMQNKERQGVYASVYKIKYLTNGQHKYKIRQTAQKDWLSGVCIFNPNFALVFVEGIDTKIKHFRQLMLHRIDWTEQARPRGDGEAADDEDAEEDGAKEEDGAAHDMADNKCELIWEGEVPERTFKGFRARHSESDTSAKQWLTAKWEGMWDLSKRAVWEGEDL